MPDRVTRQCPRCKQQATGIPRAKHLIICGDCREPATWTKLLAALPPGREGETARVNVVFTSPPYASQRKYDETSGFKPIAPDEYGDWWDAVQAASRDMLAGDGSFFVNIKEHCEDGDRHIYCKELLVRHVRQWGWRWVEEYAWTHGGTPRAVVNRFKNGWEPVWHLVRADASKFVFRPEDVRHEYKPDQTGTRVESYGGGHPSGNDGLEGQNRTVERQTRSESFKCGVDDRIISENAKGTAAETCLAYPDNVLSVGRNREALGHGAAFPVALPTFFIRAYSDRGDVICDPFLGSASTMVAAAQEGRIGVGSEISPKYVDVCRRRMTRLLRSRGLAVGTGSLEESTPAAAIGVG